VFTAAPNRLISDRALASNYRRTGVEHHRAARTRFFLKSFDGRRRILPWSTRRRARAARAPNWFLFTSAAGFGQNRAMPALGNQADDAFASAAAPFAAAETSAKVTTLLNEAGAGDSRAAAELLPLVYEQLRALAGRRMRRERADQTLQATALVHEAYLRLVDTTKVQLWASRWHFFAAAAEAMRRILVDHARRHGRIKRGGAHIRVELDNVELTVNGPPAELIALDEALNQLAREQPQKAQLVNLRYFGGLTHEEAAQALGISVSTADRHWAYARAWLYRRMAEDQGGS
jgi:RNA polymerase sigma factor (TIGR02999 family)